MSDATGRYLVLLRKSKPREGARRLADLAQVRLAHTRRRSTALVLEEHCAVVFDHIGVALLRCSQQASDRLAKAVAEGDEAILAIEAERTVYADIAEYTGAELQAYLQGYRDAIEDLSRRLHAPPSTRMRNPLADDAEVSWGVKAVAAERSRFSGKGIRIAVLDTGFDLGHPDFVGRAVTARSFIEGETAQDGNGHGTHCAGIAAGPLKSGSGQGRYGIASQAELFVGKVLSDAGAGADGSVLQGIDWAIENRCHIVSMSLGSPAQEGEAYSAVFEAVAQRALEAGTLIVAAAGNESRRPEHIAPVGHPANCPSILAVAAIDSLLDVAPFSCGGLRGEGGEVDIAAPGVDILSAWPAPLHHRRISGTSMATPFVAGIAALYAEADGVARASTLKDALLRGVSTLSAPARDVGAGLVQAPDAELGPAS